MKTICLFAALLGLTACDTQPHMSRFTKAGEPCHAIGYSWSPVWVSPNEKDVCW